MPILSADPIRSLDDLARFEAERTLAERLPERSVYDVFAGTAARLPDRVALTMVMSGASDEQPRRVTYHALLGLVRGAANAFFTLAGAGAGVAYMLPSLVETHATLWGAETAGYAVPINFLLQPDHIAELLKASGARLLVTLGPHPALDTWQKARRLRELMPDLKLLRVAPPGAPAEEGVLDFHATLAAQPSDRLIFGEPRRDDDVAAYFHTGGTTGVPRLVAHTHRSQLAAAFGGAVLANMKPNDALTATLPLFHVGGTIFCGLSAFMAGVELIVMSPSGLRNPAMVSGFWRIAQRYAATLVGAVPTAVGAVLEVPLDGVSLGNVRAGFCGAASLPPAVGARFREVVQRGLHEVYGMTEASGIIAIDAVGSEGGEGSVGWRLPYTEIVVRKREADGRLGAPCKPHEIGVIAVRGPHVTPGYRNPAHDAGVLDAGTLDTGDLGYADEQGRIHIAGRSKDLIIRSGHNIDPIMIENAMATHPAVALAAAVGQPDAYAGELPVCFVALRPGATADIDELHAHARETIGERPAWPREIYVIEAIPLTTVGKIYKPALRCDAAARLVARVLRDEHGLPDARVDATEGGKQGMRVAIMLPSERSDAVPTVERAMAAYLFEAIVTSVGSANASDS